MIGFGYLIIGETMCSAPTLGYLCLPMLIIFHLSATGICSFRPMILLIIILFRLLLAPWSTGMEYWHLTMDSSATRS